MRLVIIASLVLVVVSTPNRPSPVPLPAVSLRRWLPAPLGAAVWCRGGGSTHHGK